MWTWKSPTNVQLILVGAGAFLLGAVVHAIFGPNRGPFEPSLQAALVGTSGVLVAAAAAYLAARIAAQGAEQAAVVASAVIREEAEKDRRASAAADLRARKLPLFESVLELAGTHHRELRNQFGWWKDSQGRQYAGQGPHAGPAPEVHSTDPIWDAAVKLFAFARQDTADLAELLYRDLVAVDEKFGFDAEKHLVEAGVVDAIGSEKISAFRDSSRQILIRRTEFMKAVRSELGLRQLVDKPDGTRLPEAEREAD